LVPLASEVTAMRRPSGCQSPRPSFEPSLTLKTFLTSFHAAIGLYFFKLSFA